jgi:hypothetical protein
MAESFDDIADEISITWVGLQNGDAHGVLPDESKGHGADAVLQATAGRLVAG